MRKTFIFLVSAALILFTVFSCKKNTPSNPVSNTATCTRTAVVLSPTVTPTITSTSIVVVVLDNFQDGDNMTDTAAFGGFWYTYDDLPAQFSVSSNCGDSTIWPFSNSVAIQTPNCTPTFIMSSYALSSETPPIGVTSPYFARVYGNVDRSATGYAYGYTGFGANLLDIAGDGFRNTINATAAGYTRLQFWYKNGPTVTGTVLWKVRLGTSAMVGSGPCTMTEEVDDEPVCSFASTSAWQKFDKSLINDFMNETWGMAYCGTRSALTACASLVNGLYFYDGGATFKCTSAQALAALNAIQWQTNFGGTSAANPYDLEIAEVVFVK